MPASECPADANAAVEQERRRKLAVDYLPFSVKDMLVYGGNGLVESLVTDVIMEERCASARSSSAKPQLQSASFYGGFTRE